MIRKLLAMLAVMVFFLAGYAVTVTYSHADLSNLPPLESGDLIFETSLSHQSPGIIIASASLYSHVGVVHKHPDGSYTVIQAMRQVTETSLADFVRSGWGERFTVLRYPGLNESQRDAIVKASKAFLGRGYNYEFYLPAHEVYCSEIAYMAFDAQRLPIGTMQKIGDLHMNNPLTRKLFEERGQRHPACQGPSMTYQGCWNKVMDEPIITPASIARDPKLKTIYSNYVF